MTVHPSGRTPGHHDSKRRSPRRRKREVTKTGQKPRFQGLLARLQAWLRIQASWTCAAVRVAPGCCGVCYAMAHGGRLVVWGNFWGNRWGATTPNQRPSGASTSHCGSTQHRVDLPTRVAVDARRDAPYGLACCLGNHGCLFHSLSFSPFRVPTPVAQGRKASDTTGRHMTSGEPRRPCRQDPARDSSRSWVRFPTDRLGIDVFPCHPSVALHTASGGLGRGPARLALPCPVIRVRR